MSTKLTEVNLPCQSCGFGPYDHASYWGMPEDYLWLNTTQPTSRQAGNYHASDKGILYFVANYN